MYQQTETSECGLVCLAYISAKLGAHLDMAELRRRFPISSRGLDLFQISEIAGALNLSARGVKCHIDELSQLRLPAILHWRLRHFVVLEKVTSKYVYLHDPAKGRRRLTHAELSAGYSGIAMELSVTPEFKRRSQKGPLSIWAWIRFTPQMNNGLVQTLLLSLLLQAYVVASPFYMQLAIDQAALKGDEALLISLAVGFGLFGLFNAVAACLRSIALQSMSAHMSWDMSLRLFRHMIRLPLSWFQKRRLADTISRFDSINPIRDLVSGALIGSVIDGILAVTTLCMMFVFSWALCLVVLAGICVYIAVRLLSLPTSLRMSAETLGAAIAENGKRIETIKAIQTIKVMSAETPQETQWSNKYADLIRRKQSSACFDYTVKGVNQVFEAGINTVIIFMGALAIIRQEMSVGILYAFMAYRGQFTSAVTNIVELIIQWRLSDIYSHRLADIVLTPKEDGIEAINTDGTKIRGEIEIDNLSFRYSPYDPLVFKNLSLTIAPGQFVAIVGPSGAGKSSLMKVMCGLYPPTSGEVRIDGRTLSSWGPKPLREAIGVVMQDDELLSGTIADNVAFFDSYIDMDKVWRALEAAAMKDEVMAMPMKAETLVGDMGGSLSGGQKQRLMIARALYKDPQILFMDEATSHLDTRNESRINESLKKLKITRIVIAHRMETIRCADSVFDIRYGGKELKIVST